MVIDGKEFLEFLKDKLDYATKNVQTYHDFHGQKLADIRKLQPMDAFLYGLGSGKKEILEIMIEFVEERMGQLGEQSN